MRLERDRLSSLHAQRTMLVVAVGGDHDASLLHEQQQTTAAIRVAIKRGCDPEMRWLVDALGANGTLLKESDDFWELRGDGQGEGHALLLVSSLATVVLCVHEGEKLTGREDKVSRLAGRGSCGDRCGGCNRAVGAST